MKKFSYRSILVAMGVIVAPLTICAEEVETFTEPYMQVAVPAPEIGVITEILVREGDQVTEHQVLARLDDEILQASLAVAQTAKDAEGAKTSAETEVAIREKHLASYKKLQGRGNATQRELDRANAEYQQSLARLQSVREDLEIKRLEYLRVKTQIDQRVIAAPIGGHVVAIVKERGEFVAPTDATILHIAHLNSLKAVFSVPISACQAMVPGDTANLSFGSTGEPCEGVIEFVSPIADAESGTVRVKIRIPNDEYQFQSGVVCRWDLQSEPAGDGLANTQRGGRTTVGLGGSTSPATHR